MAKKMKRTLYYILNGTENDIGLSDIVKTLENRHKRYIF